MKEKIRAFILDELQREYSIPEGTDIDNLDYLAGGYVTSLSVVQFIIAIEDEFEIEFTDEEMAGDDIRKVGTLVALIERKISN